ncbi:hypothetical protein D9M71_133200 [compost metagenome]
MGILDSLHCLGNATTAFSVIALGQRTDHGTLVREILIKGTDRDLGALGDFTHLELIAALVRDQLSGHGQNPLLTIAAALLRGFASNRFCSRLFEGFRGFFAHE